MLGNWKSLVSIDYLQVPDEMMNGAGLVAVQSDVGRQRADVSYVDSSVWYDRLEYWRPVYYQLQASYHMFLSEIFLQHLRDRSSGSISREYVKNKLQLSLGPNHLKDFIILTRILQFIKANEPNTAFSSTNYEQPKVLREKASTVLQQFQHNVESIKLTKDQVHTKAGGKAKLKRGLRFGVYIAFLTKLEDWEIQETIKFAGKTLMKRIGHTSAFGRNVLHKYDLAKCTKIIGGKGQRHDYEKYGVNEMKKRKSFLPWIKIYQVLINTRC